MAERGRGVAFLLLPFLSLIWGYNWVLAKEALQFASPLDFAAWRALPGALVLFGLLLLKRQSLALRAPWSLCTIGLLQTAGFTGFMNLALLNGGAGKTAVLAYTMPFWTLLLAWAFLGERLQRRQWIVVGLAFLGLAAVLEPFGLAGTLVSKLLAVAAGLSWALAAVIAKRLLLRRQMGLLGLTAWQMLFGGLALALIAAVTPSAPIRWTPAFGAILLFNIVLATALGWLVWLIVLERLSAGEAGLSMLATPVVGVLASRWQLGETLDPLELTGMLLILAAIGLLHGRVRPEIPES